MASRKTKPSYIFPTPSPNPVGSDHGMLEFSEADIWNSSNPVAEAEKKTIHSCREPKKMGVRKMVMMNMATSEKTTATSASLPVNIPDWSKILKEGYKEQRKRDSDENFDEDDDDDEDEDERVPPHVYLARTRRASLSVHEGIGRTLKGRDLRRVRNAIWKKVGFED